MSPPVEKARRPSPLERIVDDLAPKMGDAFVVAALAAQRRIDLGVLVANVETGRLMQIVEQLKMETFIAEDLAPLSDFLIEANEAGRALGADFVDVSKAGPADPRPFRQQIVPLIPTARVATDLKTTNPKALLSAERQAAELLTSVNVETKQTVREIVARAYREQITAKDTARLIRDVIGLNDRQATALFNYRAGLVAEGLPDARVSTLTERYGDRLLRQRAMTIAQTEIHRASAEGQHELWRESVREGRLDANARRVWISNVGACPWCETMELINADGVPIDGHFETPDGDMISGPEESHVGCRCSTGLEL